MKKTYCKPEWEYVNTSLYKKFLDTLHPCSSDVNDETGGEEVYAPGSSKGFGGIWA